MKTNMMDFNFKDFLMDGCFLQVSPNLFKLIRGPFKSAELEHLLPSGATTLLYRPKFWSFLDGATSLSSSDLFIGQQSLDIDRVEFIRQVRALNPIKPNLTWKPVAEESFKHQFDWTQENISHEFLKKSVPIISQKATGFISISERAYLVQQILNIESYGWSYGFFSEKGSFVGLSPELLISWKAELGMAETMALAGTFSKSDENFKIILQDKKTLVEHQYVVDDIQANLQWAEKSELKVLELKHLLHLKTDFKLAVKNHNQCLEAAKQLHPTAAMGLFPRNLRLFEQFSKFDLQQRRANFAAPFGLIEQGQIQLVVAIRNIMFNSTEAEIFSGCGVTSDSDYQSELTELENKRNSVKKMLGLIDE
jgi:menaquinone-specific isochorismate synthase